MNRPLYLLIFVVLLLARCRPAATEEIRPTEPTQRFASHTSTEPTAIGSRTVDEAYWYDGVGHPISYQRRTDEYDPTGLRQSRQEQIAYEYNEAGRLARWERTTSELDGSEAFRSATVERCEYTYTAAGQASEARYTHRTVRPGQVGPWQPAQTQRFSYDAAGKLVAFTIQTAHESETYQLQGGRVSRYSGEAVRTFNAAGFIESESDATGRTEYAYDSRGNLTRSERTEAGRLVRRVAYEIDTHANPERTYPPLPGVPVLPARYGSNPNNRVRVTTTEWPAATGTPRRNVETYAYEYNAEGLPTRRVRTDDPAAEATFGYVHFP
jgi:YD repeat-containing protein